MDALNPIILPPFPGEPYYYNTTASDNTNAAEAGATAGYPFNFPSGYRFCPFDEELINDYLSKKVMNEELPPNLIPEVNLYDYSPDELSYLHPKIGENEWYFFTPRNRKYPNGQRPNRAAGSGYWKATGADKPIKDKDLTIIGFRKALVFYEGKPRSGKKTNWIMHEFRVNIPQRPKSNTNDMRLDDWVLCKIYKKADKSEKNTTTNEDLDSTQDQPTTPQPPPSHPQPLQQYNGSSGVLTTTTTVNHNVRQCNLPYFEMLSTPNHPYSIPHHHTNQPFINWNPMLMTTTMAPPVTAYHEDDIYSFIDLTNYWIFNSDPNPDMDDISSPPK